MKCLMASLEPGSCGEVGGARQRGPGSDAPAAHGHWSAPGDCAVGEAVAAAGAASERPLPAADLPQELVAWERHYREALGTKLRRELSEVLGRKVGGEDVHAAGTCVRRRSSVFEGGIARRHRCGSYLEMAVTEPGSLGRGVDHEHNLHAIAAEIEVRCGGTGGGPLGRGRAGGGRATCCRTLPLSDPNFSCLPSISSAERSQKLSAGGGGGVLESPSPHLWGMARGGGTVRVQEICKGRRSADQRRREWGATAARAARPGAGRA